MAMIFDKIQNIKEAMVNNDIGIDLGTANVLVYVKGRGIVLNEPSVAIVKRDTEEITEVGNEALKVIGRTSDKYEVVRPLREGVINRYNVTLQMVQHYIKNACTSTLVKPRVLICVPSCATELELLAVADAATNAGARRRYLVEEPIAAAIGAGLDVSEPKGKMIVDIGGGTTDIAVISLNGIVTAESIKIAGEAFDDAIMRYVREKYGVVIAYTTASKIKLKIGSLSQSRENGQITVKGRSIKTKLPETVTLTSNEMLTALYQPVTAIIEAITRVIMSAPPELVSDIMTSGIVMTGGGSLLPGLDKLVERITGIPTRVSPNALTAVVLGIGKLLDSLSEMQDGKIDLSTMSIKIN